uniref:Uncharacterized protein n=1 Tax=Anguilla anguilla TaxID=7936 RepID=A0A0E9VK66_ANGAN
MHRDIMGNSSFYHCRRRGASSGARSGNTRD